MDNLITAMLAGAYAVPGLYTARYVFGQQRQRWMDVQIRSRREWAERKGQPFGNPESVLASLRERWRSSEAEDAILSAIVSGFIWPVALVVFAVTSDRSQSPEEKLLMDEAAHRRLRELERQAGLAPLDDPGEPV